MDKLMMKGIVVGGLVMVVFGVGVVIGYEVLNKLKFVDVVVVKEVM